MKVICIYCRAEEGSHSEECVVKAAEYFDHLLDVSLPSVSANPADE